MARFESWSAHETPVLVFFLLVGEDIKGVGFFLCPKTCDSQEDATMPNNQDEVVKEPDAPENDSQDNSNEENSSEKEETFDREYVKKLRDEAAKYRTKAKELEPLAQKMRELEESKKTDLEKAQDRIKQPEEVGQASGTVR